jgi:carboxymethylenebutenolidase
MKSLQFIIIFSVLVFTANLLAQTNSKPPCCETAESKDCKFEAVDKFASFGNDAGFRNIHPNPLPSDYKDFKGEMITYTLDDGTTASGYFVKSAVPSNKWIFVFQEWWGLNDYIKKESDEVNNDLGAVNVLALDLYDGKVATTREEASQYVQSVDKNRIFKMISGASNYAGADAQIATLGWCFGGTWSLQAAIELGSKCDACVFYYGQPEGSTERLSKVECPVLMVWASQDKSITDSTVTTFKKNMESVGKSLVVLTYDAAHGFANPSNPNHNQEATINSKLKVLSFLKTNLMDNN